MLSGQEARFQAAGVPARVVGSLKAAIAAKASPTSALSIGERPGLFSPLRQFNGNMKDAFTGVVPRAADLDMAIPEPAPPPPAPPSPWVTPTTWTTSTQPNTTIGSMVTAVAKRQ